MSVYILHVNEYIKLDFMSAQRQHTCYLQLLVDHSTDVNKIHTFSFHTTGQTQIYQLRTLLHRSTGIYRQGGYSLLLWGCSPNSENLLWIRNYNILDFMCSTCSLVIRDLQNKLFEIVNYQIISLLIICHGNWVANDICDSVKMD